MFLHGTAAGVASLVLGIFFGFYGIYRVKGGGIETAVGVLGFGICVVGIVFGIHILGAPR